MSVRQLAILCTLLALPACGMRSSTSISPSSETVGSGLSPAVSHVIVKQIPILAGDIISRPYRSVGDIYVTMAKWTIFDTDPTHANINEALRKEAVAAGADAVVLTRYGTAGIGIFTYGQLEGRGRAIIYAN